MSMNVFCGKVFVVCDVCSWWSLLASCGVSVDGMAFFLGEFDVSRVVEGTVVFLSAGWCEGGMCCGWSRVGGFLLVLVLPRYGCSVDGPFPAGVVICESCSCMLLISFSFSVKSSLASKNLDSSA